MFKSLRLLWYKKGIRNPTIENVLIPIVNLLLNLRFARVFPEEESTVLFFFTL